jgi:hypothetical protein
MIPPSVRQGLDTGRRDRYATAVAGLWGGLAGTLARLESIADGAAEDLDESALSELASLQYSLHRASELALGIEPPTGAERSHAELQQALAEARDATGDVAEALEEGGAETASALVHEWRGALFRVRLVRHSLDARAAPAQVTPERPRGFPWSALAGAVLVGLGAFVFTAGAVLAVWPLWALGLALVAAGFVAYRP